MKLNVVLALLGHTAAVKLAREMQGADAYDSIGEKMPVNAFASHEVRAQQPVIEQEEPAPAYQYHEAELGTAQKKLQAYMQGKKFDVPAGHFLKKGKRAKVDPISPEGMDPWVYEYSRDNTSSTLQWHAQKDSRDIAEPNMDEEVHGLATHSGAVDVLPEVKPEWHKKKSKHSLHQQGSHGITNAERERLEKFVADMEEQRHKKNLKTFQEYVTDPDAPADTFAQKHQGGHRLHQIWGPSTLGQQQEQGEPESKKQPTGEPWALATATRHHGHHKHHHSNPEMIQVKNLPMGGTDPSDRNVANGEAWKEADAQQKAAKAGAENDFKRRLNPFDGLVHNDDGTIVDPTSGQVVQEQGFYKKV